MSCIVCGVASPGSFCAEHERTALASIGVISPATAEPETESPVSFDGGARNSAPLPSDPLAEHDRMVAELGAVVIHSPRDDFWDD